jgi:uncharacterized membrane protein YphA (DoxX/SURF4 family)
MNRHSALFAAGTLLLGAVGIAFHDFALQWQPVPAGIAMRVPLAYLSAALLIGGGAMLLMRGRERLGALLLAVFYGLWVIVLHFPRAISSWSHIGAWNGPAEIAYLTMGAVALLAASAGSMRDTLRLVARLLAGASALVFGLAHFNYIDFTATFVPAWIPPAQVFWAWATGAGHFAAGVALITGIQARLAVTLHAVMMGSFVLFVHIPRVIANPEKHDEWVMLGISSALTGAALLIRKYAT